MVRVYKRGTTKKPPCEEQLRTTLALVLSGKCSIRKAAIDNGLSKSTVHKYADKYKACGIVPPLQFKNEQHSRKIIFTKLEAELAEYLKECALLNHGLTTIDTRRLALNYAIS